MLRGQEMAAVCVTGRRRPSPWRSEPKVTDGAEPRSRPPLSTPQSPLPRPLWHDDDVTRFYFCDWTELRTAGEMTDSHSGPVHPGKGYTFTMTQYLIIRHGTGWMDFLTRVLPIFIASPSTAANSSDGLSMVGALKRDYRKHNRLWIPAWLTSLATVANRNLTRPQRGSWLANCTKGKTDGKPGNRKPCASCPSKFEFHTHC